MSECYSAKVTFKNRKGIALIITVGVLAMTVIIAVSFTMNMQLEQKIAVNYLNEVKAKYLAEAGIHKVIADIRKNTENKPYPDLVKYIEDTYGDFDNPEKTDIVNYGSFTVALQSEAKKVNINTLTNTDNAAIDLLKSNGLSYAQIAKIIDYRDADSELTTNLYTSTGWKNYSGEEDKSKVKNGLFSTIEEIKLVSGIGETTYEKTKDYITVCKPIIRGGLRAKYYKGLTGTSPNVKIEEDGYLDTIIELGEVCIYKGGSEVMPQANDFVEGEKDPSEELSHGWWESQDAVFAGGYLFSQGGEDGKLDNFGVVYEGYIDILATEVGAPIKFLLNGYDGIKLYIDGDLVIDKWDDVWTGSDTGIIGYHTFEYAGWHPIKIEFYANRVDLGQSIELQWKNQGNAFEHSDNCIPLERFGYAAPMTDDDGNGLPDYDNDGFYKIVSTGFVSSQDDPNKILAEKKISAVVKAFGAWTQTTRSEFSAPWVSSDFSTGGIRWVTWLDSCPTDEDIASEGGMHWDTENYDNVPDSLKLGYWDNFDEDVAYSAINIVGRNYFFAGYDCLQDTGTIDGDKELNLQTTARSENVDEATKIIEINDTYYSSESSNFNVFVRVWERDWGENLGGALNDPHDPDISTGLGYMPSERNSAFQGNIWYPEGQDCVGMLVAKLPDGATVKDGYKVFFAEAYDKDPIPKYTFYDFFQIYLSGTGGGDKDNESLPQANLQDKVLSFIAHNSDYAAYLYGINNDGVEKSCNLSCVGSANDKTYIRLWSNNYYDWNGNEKTIEQIAAGGVEPARHEGAYSENQAHFDNIRAIPEEGFMISTPFFAGEGKVRWGRISWHSQETGNAPIEMWLRSASKGYRSSLGDKSSFFVDDKDSGFLNRSNGSLVNSSNNWIQYKAVLKSNAISAGNYSTSSVTPVLEDVTITYLPTVETFCWREETD